MNNQHIFKDNIFYKTYIPGYKNTTYMNCNIYNNVYKKIYKYINDYLNNNNDALNIKYIQMTISIIGYTSLFLSNKINVDTLYEYDKSCILIEPLIYKYSEIIVLLYMLKFDKKKTYCMIGKKFGIPEVFTRCGYKINIMHNKSVNENIQRHKILNKPIKERDKIFIKKYGPNILDYYTFITKLHKYDTIVYSLYNSVINVTYNSILQTIKQHELVNYTYMNDMYRIIEYINIGGTLIFNYPFFSNKKTLIQLENIFNCFKKIFAIYPNPLYDVIMGCRFVCEGYKPTEKKITQNTKQFCEFIKKIINENLKLTKKITLLRQNVNILLKYAPYCDALECTYLMNRHKSFIIAKTVGLKTIDEPIETKVVTLFKHTITHHENLSIKHKIKCTLLYPPHVQENKEICENEVSGILYDINIYEPEKKEIKKLICYNKRYNKKLKMLDKCKHIKQIDKYIKKHNVLNPIHLFLKNINFSLDDKQTIVYLNDTKKYFETNISSYLNDTKITHFQSNFKQCIKNSKCVIGCCKDINTHTFQKQMLYALHCLNDDDDFILAIELPITTKIVIDLLYITYCSFKFVYFDSPKKFDNTVYIHFVGHKKSLSTKQALELDYEQDYTGKSLIQDPYVAEFVDEFIEALNCYIGMMSIHIELKIHLDTLWDELDCKTQLA